MFEPGNLLEGARRQKRLPQSRVPEGCLLDMDGELVERLVASGRATLDPAWPCFHTKLYRWRDGKMEVGVVGGTVGAPFAVLVAEELFASGCEALVTISSAGLVASERRPPFFVLVERALRDEGTSYHYLPASRYADADPALTDAVARAIRDIETKVLRGTSWTTDAPFRESASLIANRRGEGVLSVEMEAAALLAMARESSQVSHRPAREASRLPRCPATHHSDDWTLTTHPARTRRWCSHCVHRRRPRRPKSTRIPHLATPRSPPSR